MPVYRNHILFKGVDLVVVPHLVAVVFESVQPRPFVLIQIGRKVS